jgi:hypothetical protein
MKSFVTVPTIVSEKRGKASRGKKPSFLRETAYGGDSWSWNMREVLETLEIRGSHI